MKETSVEENLRKLDAALEAIGEHRVDKFVGLLAESVIWHGVAPAEPLKGRAAARDQRIQPMLDAFPDLQARKERSFGEGDWVSVQATLTGTHKGPLQLAGGRTIPPTNKPIRLPMALIAKLEGGEITELYSYWDQLALGNQLGLKA